MFIFLTFPILLFLLTFHSFFHILEIDSISLTSNVVVVFGNPEFGGLIGDGEVPPVNNDATIAPPEILENSIVFMVLIRGKIAFSSHLI